MSNAGDTSGCNQTPASLVADSGGSSRDTGTSSVINGATCNGTDTSGCGQTPATARAGFGADGVAIDQATNQVYVTNIEDTSVTTIDGATCNGTTTGGCEHTRTRATVGDYPGAIAVDRAVGTAYVADALGVSVVPLTH